MNNMLGIRVGGKGEKSPVKNGICYLNDGLFISPLMLSANHFVDNNRSTTDTHRSQKIRAASSVTAARLWHHRMGQANIGILSNMMKARRNGMLSTDVYKTKDCLLCTHSKHTRSGYNEYLILKERVITIHAGFCGPVLKLSWGQNKYLLGMTTGEQKYVRVHFLKSRSDVIGYLENYVSWLERHSGNKMRRIHTNNARNSVVWVNNSRKMEEP